MPPRRKPARHAYARPRPRKSASSPRDLERLFERAEKYLSEHEKHPAQRSHPAHNGQKLNVPVI